MYGVPCSYLDRSEKAMEAREENEEFQTKEEPG